MSDDLERLYDLHDQIDITAQRWTRTLPVGNYRGVSGEGTVEVTASAEGKVVKIVVHEGWRANAAADELGALILEAYTDSTVEALKDWEQAMEDDEEEPDPDPAPIPPLSDSFASAMERHVEEMGPEIAERTFNRLAELLQQVVDGLDEAEETIRTRLTAEYEGSDAANAVCVTLQGTGALVDVDFEDGWLANRHAANITSRLGEAVVAAQRQIEAAVPDDMFAGTPLASILALLEDTDALIYELSH
jgi:DNA-binding protein YbaB